MSTFDGFLLEYPLISIDNFEKNNYASTVYFLSHCHTDHMKGLCTREFHTHLEVRGFSKIYVSPVSRTLLVNDNKYSHLSDYMEVISLEQPTLIPVYNHDGDEELSVVVTLLPAGHCPGSVMFFFEGSNGNILYTGDFRIEKGCIQHLPHINYEYGRVKPIKTLYLDTTFCDAKSLHFPTRQQSIDAIALLIRSWIKNGPHCIIYILCSAKFGYESIFTSLYEALNIKIHIDDCKYLQYKNIPELKDSVTNDSQSTQIHACYKSRFSHETQKNGITPCGYRTTNGKQLRVRVIKPCAYSFATNIKLNDIIATDYKTRIHRVWFSTHSSLVELWDVVRHIQPQIIHANVIPEGKTEQEVLSVFEPLLRKETPVTQVFQIPPLGILKPLSTQSSTPCSGSLDFTYNIVPHQKVVSSRDGIVSTQQVETQPCSTTENLSWFLDESSEDNCSQGSEDLPSDDSECSAQTESSSEICLDSSEEEMDLLPETNYQCEQTSISIENDKAASVSSIPVWKYSPPSSPLLSSSPFSMASLSSSLDVVCQVNPPSSMSLPFSDPKLLSESDPKKGISCSSSLSLTKVPMSDLQLKKVSFQKDSVDSPLSFTDSPLAEYDHPAPVYPHSNFHDGIVQTQNPLPDKTSLVVDQILDSSDVRDNVLPTSRITDNVLPTSRITDNMTTSRNVTNVIPELRAKETFSYEWPLGSSMNSASHRLEMVVDIIDDNTDSPDVVPVMSRLPEMETSPTYIPEGISSKPVDYYSLHDSESPSILDEFDDTVLLNQNRHNHNAVPKRIVAATDSISKNKKQKVDPAIDILVCDKDVKENCTGADWEKDIKEQNVILVSSDSEDEILPTQDVITKTKSIYACQNNERWKVNNISHQSSSYQDVAFSPNFASISEPCQNDMVKQRNHILKELIPVILIDD